MTMTLERLIEVLKKHDPTKVVPRGFNHPESWRGVYEELAFRPAENVTVGDMLKAAESALGATYTGYKGGDFTMKGYTEIHISEYGESYDYAWELLLFYMLGEPVTDYCDGCGERYPRPVPNHHGRVECLRTQLKKAEEEEAEKKAKVQS